MYPIISSVFQIPFFNRYLQVIFTLSLICNIQRLPGGRGGGMTIAYMETWIFLELYLLHEMGDVQYTAGLLLSK